MAGLWAKNPEYSLRKLIKLLIWFLQSRPSIHAETTAICIIEYWGSYSNSMGKNPIWCLNFNDLQKFGNQPSSLTLLSYQVVTKGGTSPLVSFIVHIISIQVGDQSAHSRQTLWWQWWSPNSATRNDEWQSKEHGNGNKLKMHEIKCWKY